MDKVDIDINGVQVPWQERLPDVQKWSDVVGIIWADEAGDSAGALKYILRQSIVTPETKGIIRQAAITQEGEHDTRDWKLKEWPGFEFEVDSVEFNALLGTPHGSGVVFLLLEHPNEMPGKNIESVNIFATEDGDWHQLWTLTD